MSIYSRNCYTYLIGWSRLNIWYYGRRTKSGCSPDDLWNTYFTSSKYVKLFRKEFGEPDVIKVRKTFGNDYKKCVRWEENVLCRINASSRKDFLNKCNTACHNTTNVAPAFDKQQKFIGLISCDHPGWGSEFYGINKFKDLSKWINSAHSKNKQLGSCGLHHLQIKSKNGTHHWQSGSQSREYIDQLQRNLVDRREHHWQSEEHKLITSNRINEAIKEGKHPFSKKETCPHCGKIGQKAAMYRFHFKKCKAIN